VAEATNLPKLAARQGTKRRLPPAQDANFIFEILDWTVAALAATLLILGWPRPTLVHFLYSCAGLGMLVALASGGGQRYFLPNFLLWAGCALVLAPDLLPQLPASLTSGLAAAAAVILLGARVISGSRRAIERRRARGS